jgi:hypothetical protein
MAHRVIGNPKRARSTFGETITKQAWWSRFNFSSGANTTALILQEISIHGTR